MGHLLAGAGGRRHRVHHRGGLHGRVRPSAALRAESVQREVKWHTDAGDVHGSSPAVDQDGYIFVGGNLLSAPSNQRGKVFAFASTGGDPLRTYSMWSAFDSSPTHAGGAIYIGCNDGNIDSLSPLGDHLNWGARINVTAAVESSPAVDGNGALYVGGAGRMVSLQSASPGLERWSTPVSGTGYHVESSPALSNDKATVYFADGKVYALRASDGKAKWAYSTGGPVYSSPAVGGDGTVYVGSCDYKMYALDGDGQLKWSYTTGNPVESSPAIGADGTVYIGSVDGNIYAFGDGSAPVACSLSTPRTSGALKHTVAVTYSGTLSPKHVAKVTLTFQRKRGGTWKAFTTARVSTKATGVWTYKKKLKAATYRLRASTTSSPGYKAATSKWKTVVIR